MLGAIKARLYKAAAMTSPSTYVLVHGAWQGGWAWSRFALLLEAGGHQIYAPTLTGLAERASQLTKNVNLSTHIEDISRLIIAEDLDDVVLVGHSYGGMVIAGVADRMAEKVKSLVVLDGFVPEDGKAMREYWPASVMSYLDKDAEKSGGVSVPPLPAQSLAVAPENRAFVDERATPQPYATFNEVIRLAGARDTIASKHYIRATKFRSNPFDAVVKRLQSASGWHTAEIDSGHCPMIDTPAQLAELFAQMA
ncbi:MAG: alpha/beta fold hydrolase [Methylocella sp.]